MNVGDIRIRPLDGGRFRLDGGAMFGIVPKVLWQQLAPADDLNRIELGTNCLLIETAGRRVLVETGFGHKYGNKERDIYALSRHWLLDSLVADGIEPESIDVVVLTHLHFDHAGGATRWDADGRPVTTFPRAEYIVQRGEWEDANSGYAVMTATYRPENLAPLAASGRLRLVEGDGEVAPGVTVRRLPGHTRHQQGVVISGGGRTAIQPADLLPTAAHAGLAYNMAYDLLPYENMRNKRAMLEQAWEGNWILLLGHDPRHLAHQVRKNPRGSYELVPFRG